MTASKAPANFALAAGIILLTLATAFIHIRLGLFGLPLFLLNGLGYLGLIALLYLPIPRLTPYRGVIRWALVLYTALTIVLWVFLGGPYTGLGYFTKLAEVALIVLLLFEARVARR